MTSNNAEVHRSTAILHPKITVSANCPSNESLLLVLPIKAREVTEEICPVRVKDQHVFAPTSAGGGYLAEYQTRDETDQTSNNDNCDQRYNGYNGGSIDEDDIQPLGGWKTKDVETKPKEVSPAALSEFTNALNEWDALASLEDSRCDEVDRGAPIQEQSLLQQKRATSSDKWSNPAEVTSIQLNGNNDIIRARNVCIQESTAPTNGSGGYI